MSKLIDVWDIPVPRLDPSETLSRLTVEDILDCYTDVVSCDTYCPIQCHHDRRFSSEDLYYAILQKMHNGDKYESLTH